MLQKSDTPTWSLFSSCFKLVRWVYKIGKNFSRWTTISNLEMFSFPNVEPQDRRKGRQSPKFYGSTLRKKPPLLQKNRVLTDSFTCLKLPILVTTQGDKFKWICNSLVSDKKLKFSHFFIQKPPTNTPKK